MGVMTFIVCHILQKVMCSDVLDYVFLSDRTTLYWSIFFFFTIAQIAWEIGFQFTSSVFIIFLNQRQYIGIFTLSAALYISGGIKYFAACITIDICYARYAIALRTIICTIIIEKHILLPMHFATSFMWYSIFFRDFTFPGRKQTDRAVRKHSNTNLLENVILKYSNPFCSA